MTDHLPEPLVPADVDLRSFPFMHLDVTRLRDSALSIRATGEEFRAAVLLWCASWHQLPAGSLPNDDLLLAAFVKKSPKKWEKIKKVALNGFVLCADGKLYHTVVAEKANEAWEQKCSFREKKLKNSEKAKKAAAERWEKSKGKQPDTVDDAIYGETPNDATRIACGIGNGPGESCKSDATRIANADPEQCNKGEGEGEGEGDQDPIPNTERGIKRDLSEPGFKIPLPNFEENAKEGNRLSKDWTLQEDWGMWAMDWGTEHNQHWDKSYVRGMADAFRAHYLAKSGEDALRHGDHGWELTWQNWVRKESGFKRKNGSAQSNPESTITPEQRAENERRYQARMEQARLVGDQKRIDMGFDPAILGGNHE